MSDAPTRAGVLARNSFANLVRVASTSLVSLALPVILVSTLRPDLYAVWALLFGLAGFVLYLDFGLPASVQTLVARALAAERPLEAQQRGRSGIRWAATIGTVMLVGLLIAGLAVHTLFPALASRDDAALLVVVLLIGAGNVATFVGNTASAYFAGLQRSGVSALVLVPGRIASLVCAVPIAVLTQNLVLVAAAYAIPLVAGGVAMVITVLRVRVEGIETARSSSERFAVLRYSGPLAAWSVYMLCISGAGIVIVGRVDFRAVAVFSLATAFSAALTGVLSALVSPMLSELGRTHGDRARFTAITMTGTRVTVAFVALGVVGIEAVYLLAAPFLQRQQSVPAAEAAAIVVLTVLAGSLRLTMSPLTYAFVASGAHRKLLLPPLGEAVVTLVATIGLGATWGGIGVAAGLLVGAAAGVLIALLWSHRSTGVVDASSRALAVDGVLRPLLAVVPAQVLLAVVVLNGTGEIVMVTVVALMALMTALLAWRICLPPEVRARISGGALRHREVVAR